MVRRTPSPVVAGIVSLLTVLVLNVTLGSTAGHAAVATKKPLAKPVTTKKATKKPVTTKKPTKRLVKKPTTTKRRVTSVVSLAAPNTLVPATTAAVTLAPATQTLATVPVSILDPNATPSTIPATIAITPSTSTTTKPGPTTTLAPAAFPAPANPPSRPSASTLTPYDTFGVWVDRFDWTVKSSGRANPPVNLATLDVMANAGVQTIYIQAAHWSTPGVNDILEPERLIPFIDRAHALGMYVVAWYLPALQDVNTDLRKTVAVANLDIDGINIDIEEKNAVRDVPERNRRLVAYSQALRALLPGRAITNDIVDPILLDGVPNFWPPQNGSAPKANALWWGGPFPYKEIAPYYDMWMIQSYWTNRTVDSGWRDGYRYSTENINRLRNNLGRTDIPIQLIAGVGGNLLTLNELSGFLQASRETNSFGVSFYDWAVGQPAWWPYFWQFRRVPAGTVDDPRFAPVAAPAYVAQPRPVTTIPGTTLPPPSTLPGPLLPLPTTTLLPA
jgi:hypothetical protein